MTVTKKAYWVMSTSVKEVEYATVKDINFIGKKRCCKACFIGL